MLIGGNETESGQRALTVLSGVQQHWISGTVHFSGERAAHVLIGGKETESGQRALAVLKSVYQHWVPDERILCFLM